MDPELLKRIEVLAEKLGVTADHLWSVMLRQAQIETWMMASSLLLGIVGLALVVPMLKRAIHYDKKHENGLAFVSGAGAVLIGIASIGFVMTAVVNLPTLIANPEYWALKDLLSKVR
jgi:formate-dependent nitrite reductase membrane component NrfD